MAAVTTQPAHSQSLPSIHDHPEADVVIYDGNCKFCQGQIARIARWDSTGRRLAFISLHDPEVARRWPDLTHDMLMDQMYIVDRQGRRHGGAASFRYLSRRLPRLWPLAPLLHLPFTLPLWQWAYRQVARRRYKIAGKMDACETDACSIHLRK